MGKVDADESTAGLVDISNVDAVDGDAAVVRCSGVEVPGGAAAIIRCKSSILLLCSLMIARALRRSLTNLETVSERSVEPSKASGSNCKIDLTPSLEGDVATRPLSMLAK